MFDEEEKQRFIFWRSFSFLGCVVLFAFGLDNYLIGNYGLAGIELVLGLITFLNFLFWW